MFHLVSYKWFRRTENITELGLDYKEVGDRVVDVRFYLVVFWGCLFRGGLLMFTNR